MRGGGEVVCQVAEVVLNLAEGLVLGEVHEVLGHPPQDLIGVGPEPAEQVLDARFAVGSLRGRRRGGRVRHGAHPGKGSNKGFGFPTPAPAYHEGSKFSPTFAKHTRGRGARQVFRER